MSCGGCARPWCRSVGTGQRQVRSVAVCATTARCATPDSAGRQPVRRQSARTNVETKGGAWKFRLRDNPSACLASAVAPARLPSRANIAGVCFGISERGFAGAVAIAATGLACALFVVAPARAGGASAQTVVVTGPCFHAINLCLHMIAVFRPHAGDFPSVGSMHRLHRAIGAAVMPEGDLRVADCNAAAKAGNSHATSHHKAQEGAGKHAESQGPVAERSQELGSWYAGAV